MFSSLFSTDSLQNNYNVGHKNDNFNMRSDLASTT